MKKLWEILVPTVSRSGTSYDVSFHRVWDQKVRNISHGLTIMPVSKGQWVNPDGKLFVEQMIPVRIVCTEEEINEIVDMTLDYYNQEAIMAYLISSNVILRYKECTSQ